MRLSDIQPQYFPRLHYFARMLASDVFVIRDDVQFVRGHKYPDGSQGPSYQAHTPIRVSNGASLLTLPVKKEGSFLSIRQKEVSYRKTWVRKHTRAIHDVYNSSPNLRVLLPEIEHILHCGFSTVAALNIATICWAMGHILGAKLRIPDELSVEHVNHLLEVRRTTRLQRIVLGSDCLVLESRETSSASERTVALCKSFGVDEYMGGGTAIQAYLDIELLRRSGIEVVVQDWQCPTYGQQYTSRASFIPNLSIIDLLMNEPAERLVSYLTNEWRSSGAGRSPDR